jgi:hypothetical protein
MSEQHRQTPIYLPSSGQDEMQSLPDNWAVGCPPAHGSRPARRPSGIGGRPQDTLETWGWRLAFLLALPMGLVGLYLRLRLDETPRFRALQRVRDVAQWPVGEALRAYPGRMLTGFVLVAAASLTFNTLFIFLPNQLVADLGLDPTPLLAVVSEFLRLYADALRLPNPTGL